MSNVLVELGGYDQVLGLLSDLPCNGIAECSVLYLLGVRFPVPWLEIGTSHWLTQTSWI